MCGIAGILSSQASNQTQAEHQEINQKTGATIDPAIIKDRASKLKAMQDALVHRGPDDKGAFFSPSYQAALTHTRLSIIDLTDGGHQPMSSDDQRYTITYNGEIYNYKKLRTQLELEGEEFKSIYRSRRTRH